MFGPDKQKLVHISTATGQIYFKLLTWAKMTMHMPMIMTKTLQLTFQMNEHRFFSNKHAREHIFKIKDK